MRDMMLLARTGRRVSEILLLDFDACCRSPARRASRRQDPGRGSSRSCATSRPRSKARRTRSSSTTRSSRSSAPSRTGRRPTSEPCRDRTRRAALPVPRARPQPPRPTTPTPKTTFSRRLHQARRAGGHPRQRRPPVDFRRTHRFRHTRATSLINAGVPVHVVQRYLGHLSAADDDAIRPNAGRDPRARVPALQQDHRRRPPTRAWTRATSTTLLELGQARPTGCLPNGYCMLPPRQVCDRGNACLTCDKFTTDASYIDEHQQQLGRLVDLDRRTASRRSSTAPAKR